MPGVYPIQNKAQSTPSTAHTLSIHQSTAAHRLVDARSNQAHAKVISVGGQSARIKTASDALQRQACCTDQTTKILESNPPPTPIPLPHPSLPITLTSIHRISV